jgi:hypothetical protein
MATGVAGDRGVKEMSIEAMKQALEALETPLHAQPWGLKQNAIVAIRAAIEQTEKQEPVAWMHKETGLLRREISKAADWYSNYWQPLYAAPREWVGLTEEEIAAVMNGSVEGERMLPYQFARAIETKLKAKNNG